MDSDLAWVNGKSGRQSWCYADACQRCGSHLPSFLTLNVNISKTVGIDVQSALYSALYKCTLNNNNRKSHMRFRLTPIKIDDLRWEWPAISSNSFGISVGFRRETNEDSDRPICSFSLRWFVVDFFAVARGLYTSCSRIRMFTLALLSCYIFVPSDLDPTGPI